jgi:hypothetical protein
MKIGCRNLFLLFALCGSLGAQGFINLNFENPTFTSDPSSPYYPYVVYASNALPGWTAYVAGSVVSEVFSNDYSLSGGSVSIIDTNNNVGYPPVQGKYFVLLKGFNYPGYLNTAGIGQTGTIPSTAQSMTFWGYAGADDVSFAGHTLPLTELGSTPNYIIYGVNVAAYAGQTGQLLFTTVPGGTDIIDNILFSSSSIPEPGVLSLLAVTGLLLASHRQRKCL